MTTRLAVCAVLLTGACVDGDEHLDIDRTTAAVEVTWTNVVGVTATGNDLSKEGGTSAWNAGAVSVETLVGDGYAEFTTAESTTTKTAGLSNGDGGQEHADIDFAIRLRSNGSVGVYEAGVLRGSFGTYVAGDVFRVEVEAGVVTYRRNGALLYTSAVAPAFPLLVDTALLNPGATITDVELVATSLDWQNVVGVSVSGNDLAKTATTTGWSAGASSVQTLTGDGFVEFSTAEASTAKAAGLSSGDGGQNYTDIDFAIRLNANGAVAVYEAGVLRGTFGTYIAGDIFRVETSSGEVSYSRNGGLPFYTSAAAPTFPLLVDTAFLTTGGTINDVVMTEAANACPTYDGGGLVCDGSFVVNNAFDLAEVVDCANITGNLTIEAPGMTVIALPALERVGGNLTINGNNTLARLRLPQLKEVGGTLRAFIYQGTGGFDLSRLRSGGRRIEAWNYTESLPVVFPCLDDAGTLLSYEWDGTQEVTGLFHVPRLRQIVDRETLGMSFISAHLDAPMLEDVEGHIVDGTIDAPVLTTVAGQVTGFDPARPILDAPILTSVGGMLDYWEGTNVPALQSAGGLFIKDRSAIDLPDLADVTGGLTGDCAPSSPITATSVDLPSLERAGGVNLCWPALESASLPELREVTGPSNLRGLYVRPNSAAVPLDLPLLESVRGGVQVWTSASYPVLTYVRGGFTVWYPASAPLLTQVDAGRLRLHANLSAGSLTTVGGMIEVYSGTTSISLPALTTIDGFYSDTAGLMSLDLPSLTSTVGATSARYNGDFRLQDSAVTQLDLSSLQSVADELRIENNDSLTVLGAPALTSLGPLLRIVGNAILPNCYATNIRDQLLASGWTGTTQISGNNGTGTCP
jgi:hypothetical protein